MGLETITYEERVQGFPSFYSYLPDWMIGMNNYFYTFKNGELYRHNVNETRNEFYGITDPNLGAKSTLRSVFNDQPLENKLFKTANIEGDTSWKAEFETDIQDSGLIENAWWEKKEQTWYGFIRNEGTVPAAESEYVLRSLNGLGKSETVTIAAAVTTIDFPLTVRIGSVLSVGDMFYYAVSPDYDTPVWAGEVTAINVNLPTGVNQIVLDNTGGTPVPNQDDFYLYIKNAISESHGVLGHYCVFDLENEETTKIELFAFESEVMKSYP